MFYQSRERTIQTLGVIEQIQVVNAGAFELLQQLVAKRTVYSKDQLRTLSKQECLVILFRLIKIVEKSMILPKEINPPQSISTLTHEKYSQHFKGYFNHE